MMGIAASRPARVTNIGLSFVPQTTMKVAKYTKQVFSGSGQQHRAMIDLTSTPIHSAVASMQNTKYAPASGHLYMLFSHLKCSFPNVCMTLSHLIQIFIQTSFSHKAFQ